MRCAADVAPVRAEPRDDAEQVTQALHGEPLEVGERRDGWARVTTAYGYPGWVREDALCGDEPLSLARSFLGTPYEWGGLTKAGIDCSGLVHMAHRLAGRLVPRDSWQQEDAGIELPEDELKPGDLTSYGAGQADHVAFWVAPGRVLHSRGGAGVIEEPEPDDLAAQRRRFFRL
jgi:hypothetical protein